MARDSIANPVLELRNVDLRFGHQVGGHEVLKGINLKIQKGERVAVIGPSGQGKSSILKLLAGLLKPTAGQVFIEGRDFHALAPREQQELRLRMGMLFQKNALFDSLRNLENVCFPLREARRAQNAGVSNETQLISKAKSYLEAVGLGHAGDLFPDEISGGMQKRLGIARALILDPEIIFYDDPTAGLDPITSRKIVDLMNELQRQRSSTLVAVTNDMNRARQLADRVLMVVDRQLLDLGSPDEMRQHSDPRVQQFITGNSQGPLTEAR